MNAALVPPAANEKSQPTVKFLSLSSLFAWKMKSYDAPARISSSISSSIPPPLTCPLPFTITVQEIYRLLQVSQIQIWAHRVCIWGPKTLMFPVAIQGEQVIPDVVKESIWQWVEWIYFPPLSSFHRSFIGTLGRCTMTPTGPHIGSLTCEVKL